MTPESMSLYISIFSIAIATLALGWNIYRDVILKPRVKMRVSVSRIVSSGIPDQVTKIDVSATNFGPGKVRCNMVDLRNAPLWRRILRRAKYAVVIEDYENPMSGHLPAKLDVGETIDLLFPYNQECFLSRNFTHVGVRDSFGRSHWTSRKDFSKAQAIYDKDFKDRKSNKG